MTFTVQRARFAVLQSVMQWWACSQWRSQPKNLGGAKKFGGGQNAWF